MATLPPDDRAHYGCHEFREDAELVIGGRATPRVSDAYRAHRKGCPDCARVHQVLYELYRGPRHVPHLDLAKQAEEFNAIQTQLPESLRPRARGGRRRRASAEPNWSSGPSGSRWSLSQLAAPLGVGGLVAAAVLLTMSLFSPAETGLALSSEPDPMVSARALEGDATIPHAEDELDQLGGLGHRAQSFGRVVAGAAELSLGDRHLSASSFPPGTSFVVPDNGVSLQLALIGKILANFEAGSRGHWESASANVVAIRLDRGRVAIRYDRLEQDPILLVRTPSALVRVVGTVFTVAVDDDGITTVSVLRGHVEVLDPEGEKVIAEVDAGYRFEVGTSTYTDVGRSEVAIALPVSNEQIRPGAARLADGRIPDSWVIPGLPKDPEQRVLTALLDTEAELDLDNIEVDESAADGDQAPPPPPRRRQAKVPEDDGADVMQLIVEEVKRARAEEVSAALEVCRELYASTSTRFRAAACLTDFMREYGDEPGAAEGLLLIGILRMDFAQDHTAAARYFEKFLRRVGPNHPLAEHAVYRLWLAATEQGLIREALERGRKYLQVYPDGEHVGRILQRFPELKSEL